MPISNHHPLHFYQPHHLVKNEWINTTLFSVFTHALTHFHSTLSVVQLFFTFEVLTHSLTLSPHVWYRSIRQAYKHRCEICDGCHTKMMNCFFRKKMRKKTFLNVE